MNSHPARIDALVRSFEALADPKKAEPMKRYMRNQFEFLGIKTPERRAMLREYLSENEGEASKQLRAVVGTLWKLPYREYQYAAVDLLERFSKTLTAGDLPLIERLITRKSWWDTVDGLAASVVGPLLQRFPESRDESIGKWRHTQNIWLRRTTVIFQLKYKADTDARLLFSIIRDNQTSSEFFLQKAIGWALREYSKTNARAVVDFVGQSPLAPLSKREALKWLKSRSR